MGFTDSLKKVIGIEELGENDVVTEEEILEEKERIAREGKREERVTPAVKKEREPQYGSGRSSYGERAQQKRYSLTGTNSWKLIVIEPKGFEECPKLVDNLKARKPVILNLEKLETEIARKIFDFLSGATYALNGNVQKITSNVFIFTPENVAVAATQMQTPAVESEDDRNPWR